MFSCNQMQDFINKAMKSLLNCYGIYIFTKVFLCEECTHKLRKILRSFRNQWLTVALLLVLTITLFPLVQAKPKVDVDFAVAQDVDTVYVTAWAQGELPPWVLFSVEIWYNAPGTHGFVNIFSGTLLAASGDGYAWTFVQVTIPGGGTDQTGHYFVSIGVYDPVTGDLLGHAGHDPRAGGTNGGAGT